MPRSPTESSGRRCESRWLCVPPVLHSRWGNSTSAGCPGGSSDRDNPPRWRVAVVTRKLAKACCSSKRCSRSSREWGSISSCLICARSLFSASAASFIVWRLLRQEACWPDTEAIFSMSMFGHEFPLLLIAVMTFILITSSGSMAMAVNYAYRGDRWKTVMFMSATALLWLSFVGMQAFEWYQLIVNYDIRPWGNPLGAAQFGAVFFMITGFHGLHLLGVLSTSPSSRVRCTRAIMRKKVTPLSRSRACTGTSWTWCGCLSSLSSTYGRG